MSYSSNITIQNCVFQHSIGQAVVLVAVSGGVIVVDCQFLHNNNYVGHGTAIRYSSNLATKHLSQLVLTISNCNFSYNRGTESLVYNENSSSDHNNNITICCSKFCYNQGITSIHVINQKLNIADKVIVLSSIVPLKHLDHISIIGHNNPSVICLNGGRLTMEYCQYTSIEGITWIGCEDYSNIHTPVIHILMHNSTYLHIQNCSFQHSIVPVIATSQGSKSVTLRVSKCNFMNNNQHRDHGVAIHDSMKSDGYGSYFVMNNCRFNNNGPAKSIIYSRYFSIHDYHYIYIYIYILIILIFITTKVYLYVYQVTTLILLVMETFYLLTMWQKMV